jgi:hypothetical protein
MINKKDESLIASIAYDATIGCGSAAEEPSDYHYAALAKRLGRTALVEDLKFFRDEWRRNLQMMAQP